MSVANVPRGANRCRPSEVAAEGASSRPQKDHQELRFCSIGLQVFPALVRLLDEWQVAPALWNQVRRAVDR